MLKTGPGAAVRGLLDPTGLKLDADALLQGFARAVRAQGGEIRLGRRIATIERRGEAWIVDDSLSAPDPGQRRRRLGRQRSPRWPAWRRSASSPSAAPSSPSIRRPGADIAAWPFVHSVAGDFYMLPEAGRLLVSPVDEVADDPCDAQPDDYDIALAADRLEHYTIVRVARIAHRWAGLRTFTADRVPTAGFAPDAPGFFWLAGQGGYGLQTAPAMARDRRGSGHRRPLARRARRCSGANPPRTAARRLKKASEVRTQSP